MKNICTKNIRTLVAISLLGFLTACGTTSSVNYAQGAPDPSTLSKKDPTQIIVTKNDITDRPYTTLGDISATVRKRTIFDRDPTPALVDEELKQRAAEIGADAVVLTRYGSVGIGFTSWGVLDGNGRAVVFK